MLEVENLEVVYDRVMRVLDGVSFSVPAGRIVALLGANGAGKTTVLRAVSGLLDIHDGEVTKGRIVLEGEEIHRADAASIVVRVLTQALEGRRVFAELTVEENLRLGGHTRPRAEIAEDLERIFELFAVLRERRAETAGLLSGGEQQMLAMGRALMARPRVLLLDEPSLGLAPRLVRQVRDLISEIHRRGTTVLLVEQNAAMALAIADHGYVLENGRVVMDKPARELLDDDDVREFYLGLHAAGGAKSFRDVKHYKRRKRWLS